MNRAELATWIRRCGVAAAAFLAGMTLLRAAAPPEKIQEEYDQRLARLEPDDLAEPASQAGPPLPRVISDEEIQRVRWMEMMEEEPRPLAVQFKNDVLRRFLEAMEGKAGFTTREERADFMKLKPADKVRLIRKHTGEQFAEDIVLKTDPQRMVQFEREVLPVVLAGCATALCHGDPQVSRFALYNDRLLSKNKVYTDYLILHGYRVGDQRVIKRDNPHQSLLLTYGFAELPPDLDPTYKHPGKLDPLFRGTEDPKYRVMRKWIESLSALEPDYKISLEPAGSGP